MPADSKITIDITDTYRWHRNVQSEYWLFFLLLLFLIVEMRVLVVFSTHYRNERPNTRRGMIFVLKYQCYRDDAILLSSFADWGTCKPISRCQIWGWLKNMHLSLLNLSVDLLPHKICVLSLIQSNSRMATIFTCPEKKYIQF